MTNIDWTKPVEYFNGDEWVSSVVLYIDRLNDELPVVVWARELECLISATLDGRKTPSSLIIFRNVPLKHVRYINMYENGQAVMCESRQAADLAYELLKDRGELDSYLRTECIRVEYEDGQFDD